MVGYKLLAVRTLWAAVVRTWATVVWAWRTCRWSWAMAVTWTVRWASGTVTWAWAVEGWLAVLWAVVVVAVVVMRRSGLVAWIAHMAVARMWSWHYEVNIDLSWTTSCVEG